TSIEDLCAGLAYSVARNYLDRVVASRPVGESIVFQGGVASNSAVMAAFEKITGKTVHVHPFNGVSGAIGAARMVRDAAPEKSNWRGYHSCGSYELSTFECKACSNRCQVSRFVIDGRRVHFGDACERFSARDANTAASDLPDVIELREKIVQQFSPKVQNPKAILGMPRSSVFIELAPFWSTFFAHLGIQLELSAPSSFDTLQAGLRRMPAETCLPMKLAFGQLEQLAKARTEQAPRMHIFLPSIVGLPSEPQSMAYACPYVQAVPFMARAALEAPLLTPEVDLKGEDSLFLDGMEETLHILDVSRSDAQLALTRARAALQQYRAKMVELGHQQLASLDWALVVIGKPYNVLDSHLNLNLFKHLRKLGAPALPMWFLPLEDISLEEPLTTLPWHYNREIAKGLLLTLKSRRLFPVLVSNFGCGPDAFTHKHLDALLGEKPYLSLEFDEHRGEAGLITRLEAFLDEVRQHRHSEQVTVLTHLPKKESASGSAPPRFKNVKKFFVPYFSDHSHAFAAALRASGYEAEMLPIPNEQSRALGESYSSGKECHPYSMIAGDLVTLAKRQRAGGEVFVFPGTTIPCLLQQYGEGHRLILERMGVEDLDIWTPNAEGMRKLMGIDNLARMWQGFVAIDTLIKAQCEIRPYETIPGTVDAIHRQNIADLEMAIASGDIGAALAMASTRLRNVQVNRRRARPLVGVAGDIYTRINHAANHDLFRWLEEQGCEVWPAPFMVDIIDFGFRRDIDIMLRKGQYAMAALSSVLMLRKDIETWLAKRHLRSTTARMDEPGYAEVVALAKRYVGQESNEVLTLNVAKMVDFARRGAHGVINAICFGCMLGTISVAITRRIREDNNNIPIANLFYSGSPDAQLGMLEAFVHQVHERYRKQQSRGEGDW
ncbi:MAG: acyl-CoA dehydratase activase-related protein, partial [Myxococcota bacterium]|nr:acyl-CoA dehydratase activase-related protein [Myxococcota bacterium]